MPGWIWIFEPKAAAKWHPPLLLMKWQKHTWMGWLYFPGWHTHTTEHTALSLALHKSSYTWLQLKRCGAICSLSSRNLWIDLRGASRDNKSEQREGHRGFRCVQLWFSVDSARRGWRLSFTASTTCSGWNLDPVWMRFWELRVNRHLKWSSDGGTTE